MTEQNYWNELKKTGWLKYVPSKSHRQLRARIRKSFVTDREWVHLALRQIGFDTECIDDANSYSSLLRDFRENSNGLFRPTKISAQLIKRGRKKLINVSFQHHGEVFSCLVAFETDWCQEQVLDLVNQALESKGKEERFIVLPSGDQLAFIAIVPPQVYDSAVRAALIPKESLER